MSEGKLGGEAHETARMGLAASRGRALVVRLGLASVVCLAAAEGAVGCDSDDANGGDGGAGGERDSTEPGSSGSGGRGTGGDAPSSGGSSGGGDSLGGSGGGDVAGAAGMGGGCSDCCDPEDPPCAEDWELVCYNDWNVTHYCCDVVDGTRSSCRYDGDFYDNADGLCICDAPVWPPIPS